MATDINRVILFGRLVRDPELKHTAGGTAVANFSIANNKSYTTNGEKKEEVSFFNCIYWSKGGEILVKYCKKGSKIGIEGRLQQKAWEDQNGSKRTAVEIVVENFQFLDGKKPEDQQSPVPNEPDSNPFSDDDIGF